MYPANMPGKGQGPPRILLVEDDVPLAAEVADFLTRNNFSVRILHRGEMALAAARDSDLVVLDWMLPGMDGLSVCRAIRRKSTIPILMLTAREGDALEVEALNCGADDYLAKPVRPSVLLARIQALLRRVSDNSTRDSGGLTIVGRIQVDSSRRQVTIDGNELSLTDNEFLALHMLARHAGRVVTRDDLSLALQGRPYDGLDRTVDQYIARIRRILGDDARSPKFIKTVRGEGYLMVGEVKS